MVDQVMITVYKTYYSYQVPADAAMFIDWLKDKAKEFDTPLSSINIDLDTEEGYDDYRSPVFALSYSRPKTQEEITKEKEREKEAAKRLKEYEYKNFLRLKKEFEGDV